MPPVGMLPVVDCVMNVDCCNAVCCMLLYAGIDARVRLAGHTARWERNGDLAAVQSIGPKRDARHLQTGDA